ncbi:MAG: hypothetical protein LW832_07585, partial [Parachlamydia sp.]|nr:hypothetical protein [Parachlamydia sp.]
LGITLFSIGHQLLSVVMLYLLDMQNNMNYKQSSDGCAIVDADYHWIEINDDTPINAMMLLINKHSGVLHKGTHNKLNNFFTHWAPLPTFKKDTK